MYGSMKSTPPTHEQVVQFRADCFIQTLDGFRIVCVNFEQKAVQKCQGVSFHTISIAQSDKDGFQNLCDEFQSVPEVFRHDETFHNLELYWKPSITCVNFMCLHVSRCVDVR